MGLKIDTTEIVAIHRIPGKQGAPRPILLKFLRMDSKIAAMRKRKDINETMQIQSNGHIYGTK